MEEKQIKRKKMKKAIAIIFIALLALSLLAVLLGVSAFFLKKNSKKTDALPSNVFYEADYEKNIFEDPAYQQLDRSVYYMQYDSGYPLTEENYTSAGVASEFFYLFFDAIVRGDSVAYLDMLTDNYIDDFDPPERFTMQMIYDIEVNQVQKTWTTTYQGNDVTVYYFAVKYKIFENNGTFRNDVASNQSTTQYYELFSYGGGMYLNNVTDKKVIPEGQEK